MSIIPTDFNKIFQSKISLTSVQWGANCSIGNEGRKDGRTDMMKLYGRSSQLYENAQNTKFTSAMLSFFLNNSSLGFKLEYLQDTLR